MSTGNRPCRQESFGFTLNRRVTHYANVVLSHFSSNQGGLNIGTGVTFKPNADGKGKFFAEARSVWVDSQKSTVSNLVTGTVGMIPVIFGFRW
jgi:hypothetical protein